MSALNFTGLNLEKMTHIGCCQEVKIEVLKKVVTFRFENERLERGGQKKFGVIFWLL